MANEQQRKSDNETKAREWIVNTLVPALMELALSRQTGGPEDLEELPTDVALPIGKKLEWHQERVGPAEISPNIESVTEFPQAPELEKNGVTS